MLTILHTLKDLQLIGAGDFYFAKLIADKQPPQAENITHLATLAAALCSHALQQGNVCLPLTPDLPERFLRPVAYRLGADYAVLIREKIGQIPVSQWQNVLKDNVAFTVNPTQKTAPLVFQFGALYLWRNLQDEQRVADYLQSAVNNSSVFLPDRNNDSVRAALNRYFPDNEQTPDWQKIAAAVALRQPFCVISGGPGTGKTTTVAKLLAALQQLNGGNLHIQLAAPTGKAAARLEESLTGSLHKLSQAGLLDDALRRRIPTHAQTIHRLLGVRPFSDETRYHRHNPLPVDVLVVDEASMIDLALMATLMQALKPATRLILLGDKDQLTAVEAGSVLAELISFHDPHRPYSAAQTRYLAETVGVKLDENPQPPRLADSLASLKFSYRTREAPYILTLAALINQGDGTGSRAEFTRHPALTWHELPKTPQTADFNPIYDLAVAQYAVYLRLLKDEAKPKNKDEAEQNNNGEAERKSEAEPNIADVFAAFNSFRFLTALRSGDTGVETLNQRIAERLRQAGLVQFTHSHNWYRGKPVMITQNDDAVKLYNGDIGLYLSDGMVYFEQGEGQYRAVPIGRIPAYEPAFAMTVHKSQGSEFAHTALVLPTEFNPVLSRELVYTAVTRAKTALTVFAAQHIWQDAVATPINRHSGLRQRLAEA